MSEPIHGVEKKMVATYPGDRSEPERFRRLLGRVYGSPTPPPPPSNLANRSSKPPAKPPVVPDAPGGSPSGVQRE